MGSGHFLVEATNYVAREMSFTPGGWPSRRIWILKRWPRRILHWARREVVRNCIYGVDLNPMAVELAKLSLWLTTVASNKPLTS